MVDTWIKKGLLRYSDGFVLAGNINGYVIVDILVFGTNLRLDIREDYKEEVELIEDDQSFGKFKLSSISYCDKDLTYIYKLVRV
jgi:hypothetical protein